MNSSYKEYASKEYVDNSRIQADLNQNDSTAPDYVKGRLCYEEVQVLADFTTTTMYEEVKLEKPLPLVIGEKYIVGFNGVEIEVACVRRDDYDSTPWIYASYMVGNDYECSLNGGAELLTIAIPSHVVIKKRTALVKLPEKFIPDSIERVENTPYYADYNRFKWEEIEAADNAKRPIYCWDESSRMVMNLCEIYKVGSAKGKFAKFCGLRMGDSTLSVWCVTLKGDGTSTRTIHKLVLAET